ncbi:MAG TPA: type II toxin-antitoxin system RelE/ParE family toxin [Rhizomicrobium sp.]
MNVVLSGAAEADLEAIGDWIAQDAPMRAVTFVRELRTACESLGSAPNAYRLSPGHERAGIRQRAYGNYLIFYTSGEHVDVLRILEGSRDYEAMLFPKP